MSNKKKERKRSTRRNQDGTYDAAKLLQKTREGNLLIEAKRKVRF